MCLSIYNLPVNHLTICVLANLELVLPKDLRVRVRQLTVSILSLSKLSIGTSEDISCLHLPEKLDLTLGKKEASERGVVL